MFEGLKEKNRLSTELESANQTIATQVLEIAKLRDAIKVRSECIKELCACIDAAAPWIDPVMIGPLTPAGEVTRVKLLDRIDAALKWAGHRKPETK